jgi:hypothetical protein
VDQKKWRWETNTEPTGKPAHREAPANGAGNGGRYLTSRTVTAALKPSYDTRAHALDESPMEDAAWNPTAYRNRNGNWRYNRDGRDKGAGLNCEAAAA